MHFIDSLIEQIVIKFAVSAIERSGAPEYAAEVVHSLLEGLKVRRRWRLLCFACMSVLKMRWKKRRQASRKVSRSPSLLFAVCIVGFAASIGALMAFHTSYETMRAAGLVSVTVASATAVFALAYVAVNRLRDALIASRIRRKHYGRRRAR